MYNPRLETFVRVADAGSFSKAAEESYITPTAVIKQVNLLEAELGVRLFVRTYRGVVLTEAGKSVYRDARYIIQYAKDSLVRAQNAVREDENVIRIGTSPITPSEFLMELWPKIHEECSDMKFQLVPFENTPENAREILRNLGQNIDIVAGLFDGNILKSRGCVGVELTREPICCAVSVHHRLADRTELTMRDLYGENFMLIRRNWNSYVDGLRDDIEQNHGQVNVVDFSFYDTNVFNRCENSNDILMTVRHWASVHPLLKILPVSWDHSIPFGLLHSPEPSEKVLRFLNAVRALMES